MDSQLITGLLESAGYRPITVRSYMEFISGVRYVSIETLGSEGFTVLQFIPTESKAHWDIVRWEDDRLSGPRASLITSAVRSELESTAKLSVGYDWYAKVADRVNVTRDYFIMEKIGSYEQRKNRGWHFKTVECFLGDESEEQYGVKNPFDVRYAFEKAHPANQVFRQLVDIDRVKAELDAREAAVKQKENFAEVDELRLIGAQFAQRGEQAQANAYFRASDDLRRRVQNKLDNGIPVIRENVVVPVIAAPQRPMMLPMRQQSSIQELEVAKTHKRKITLEDN